MAPAAAHTPNGRWCADYKGEYLLGNKQYCYPLTISDYRSRYLLACEGLESTQSRLAFSIFERTFMVAALGDPPPAHPARAIAAEVSP